jgi:hypothetical protein
MVDEQLVNMENIKNGNEKLITYLNTTYTEYILTMNTLIQDNLYEYKYNRNNHNLYLQFDKDFNEDFKIERHICEGDPLNIYICRYKQSDILEVMKIQNEKLILNIKDNYNDLFWKIYDIFKNIYQINDVINLVEWKTFITDTYNRAFEDLNIIIEGTNDDLEVIIKLDKLQSTSTKHPQRANAPRASDTPSYSTGFKMFGKMATSRLSEVARSLSRTASVPPAHDITANASDRVASTRTTHNTKSIIKSINRFSPFISNSYSMHIYYIPCTRDEGRILITRSYIDNYKDIIDSINPSI